MMLFLEARSSGWDGSFDTLSAQIASMNEKIRDEETRITNLCEVHTYQIGNLETKLPQRDQVVENNVGVELERGTL